jgi:N utilization substance protein B
MTQFVAMMERITATNAMLNVRKSRNLRWENARQKKHHEVLVSLKIRLYPRATMSEEDKTKARKFSFQFYYHKVFNNEVVSKNKDQLFLEFEDFTGSIELPSSEKEFIANLLITTQNYDTHIKNDICDNLKHWKYERIDLISKTILKLAISEMKYLENPTGGKIVINEYLEISKTYGDKDSKSFINGLLDKIYKSLDA